MMQWQLPLHGQSEQSTSDNMTQSAYMYSIGEYWALWGSMKWVNNAYTEHIGTWMINSCMVNEVQFICVWGGGGELAKYDLSVYHLMYVNVQAFQVAV